MDNGQQVHRQIRLALLLNSQLEDIMDAHQGEVKWERAVAEDFLSKTSNYLALLTAIGGHYHAEGALLFNVTMKAHYMLHIA
eukprot:14371080-Alexandrium_andersonii.AAC.1